MPCCCIKTLNLCNVGVCGILEFKQVAISESGIADIYTLLLDYMETAISLVQEQTPGENIKFNVSNLNENFQYTGKIYDSAGNMVPIVVGSETFDCVKFKTILSLYADTLTAVPPILTIQNTVVIEDIIGDPYTISGTTDIVNGLEPGSTTIQCDAFAGVRVVVIRGNIPLPGIDQLDGSEFMTKILANDFITLTKPLALNEYIRIQTIPE